MGLPNPLISCLILLGLAACTGDSGAESTTTAPPEVTTSSVDEVTTTTSGVQAVFGWLRSYEDFGDGVIIEVDLAEMLSGEDAVAAAREDGVIADDEDLPNDFYIRNLDESTSEFTVSPNVVVTLQACYPEGECVTTEQVDLDTWSVLLGAEVDPGLEWDWYGAGTLPYWFTLDGSTVTAIEEQYLP